MGRKPKQQETKTTKTKTTKTKVMENVKLNSGGNDEGKQAPAKIKKKRGRKPKVKTEKEFTTDSHFGLGLWIRNNWGLWKGSRLSNFFIANGIFHPDDMSGIILTSYHRKLNGIEIQLEKQIKYYQEYWDKQKKE